MIAQPVVTAPAAREVSFGRVAGLMPAGAHQVTVSADGRVLAVRHVRGRSFDFVVDLPRREVTVRISAGGPAAAVPHVLGLPRAAAPRTVRARPSPTLAARLAALTREFPGTSAVYVADLSTGRSAGLSPSLRFPAASTLKLAIAVETLRELATKPDPGSDVEDLLEAMLERSDNDAANALEVRLGGSTSGGGARIDELLRSLDLDDTEMYGGYERSPASSYVPVAGKYTTAHDLARLLADVHLAAAARGPLPAAGFTPPEARYLLYLLAHVPDRGKLGRFLPADATLLHKAGWIAQARHDAGLVYWRGGVFVVAVMTYDARGAGDPSDVLAGQVARTVLSVVATPRRGRRPSDP